MANLSLPDPLTAALAKVNSEYPYARAHNVSVKQYLDEKSPVFLEMDFSEKTPIGPVHLVRLEGKSWDETPYSDLSLSAEELAGAIERRIRLFFQCKEKPNFHIDPVRGNIYETRNCRLTVHERSFSFDGHTVTHDDKSIPLWILSGEGVLKFVKREDGVIEVQDPTDCRENVDMFIDKNKKIVREDPNLKETSSA